MQQRDVERWCHFRLLMRTKILLYFLHKELWFAIKIIVFALSLLAYGKCWFFVPPFHGFIVRKR